MAAVAGAIAVFSLLRERGELPENTTMYDLVLGAVPEGLRGGLDAGLVDDVFASVSSHGS